jgi:hypothetical protein
MKPSQYWEWKAKVIDLQLKETKALAEHRLFEMMNKDLEIARLKTLSFKHSLHEHALNKDASKKEYEEFRKQLSEKLGFDLKDCVIDEHTFEVKKLED